MTKCQRNCVLNHRTALKYDQNEVFDDKKKE